MEDIKSTLKHPAPWKARSVITGRYSEAVLRRQESRPHGFVTVPALLIAGSADGSIDGSRFARARPTFAGPYTFVELDGVGHFPQLEAPDKAADAILSFLKAVR